MSWKFWKKRPSIYEADYQRDRQEPYPAKPRIIVSLDRSWSNILGFTWFTYFRLIRRVGCVPLRVDYGTGPEPENQNEIVARIIQQGNALLLSGGGDVDPSFYRSSEPAKKVNIRRDTFELALIEEAMKHRMPIMGICRGCQLLNVALGGTLQTIRNREEYRRYHNRFRTHPVTIEPDSRLYQTVKAKHLPVRSLHGQAVDRVGEGLRIIARANDGLPEAIENTPSEEGHWMVGVQWHPELMPFKNQEHLLMDEFSHQARQFILDTRSAQ